MTPHMLAADHTAASRLRDEFIEMPGLLLTVAQVGRLLGIRTGESSQLLASLEREGFLVRTASGAYRLASPPLA